MSVQIKTIYVIANKRGFDEFVRDADPKLLHAVHVKAPLDLFGTNPDAIVTYGKPGAAQHATNEWCETNGITVYPGDLWLTEWRRLHN
jgi:hypothetical protein